MFLKRELRIALAKVQSRKKVLNDSALAMYAKNEGFQFLQIYRKEKSSLKLTERNNFQKHVE